MDYRTIKVNGGGGGTMYDFREAEAVMRVLQNGAVTSWKEVQAFEEEFAAFVGAKHALAVSSCIAALHLPLLVHGFQPGDEVIVPAMTFRGTANPAEVQYGNVRFVDAKEDFNIDPAKIEEKITKRTRAVYVVHMCGQPCDMDETYAVAGKHGVMVIEDAAHAAGASYKGRKIGGLSDYTAFSFQFSKNMSTLGEGGMLTFNRDDTLARLRDLRSNGMASLNYRMNEAQGAVGRVQLTKVAGFNALRKRNTHYLFEALRGVRGLTPQIIHPDRESTYHLANILVDEREAGISRDALKAKLADPCGVWCSLHYSPVVPAQEYYARKYDYKPGQYPVGERLAAQVLSLPIGPAMDFPRDLDYIVAAIKECMGC